MMATRVDGDARRCDGGVHEDCDGGGDHGGDGGTRRCDGGVNGGGYGDVYGNGGGDAMAVAMAVTMVTPSDTTRQPPETKI